MNRDHSVAIYFLLLLVPFFWGGAFVAAEHIITEIPPITAAAFRFGVAGFILLIYTFARGAFQLPKGRVQWMLVILMAMTGIFGYNLFFFIGLQMTSAINGSLIVATSPVFITLGAVFLFSERWNWEIGFGLVLSLIGVTTVISEGSLATLIHLQFNVGDFLFIGALFCWVAHGLLGRKLMMELSPIVVTTLTTIIGATVLTITSLTEAGQFQLIAQMSAQSWSEMAFIILFSSVIGFFLWNRGVQQIGASQTSIYMNLVPIYTVLIAVFLYRSSITYPQIFGMILVVVGVYFVTGHQFIKQRYQIRRRAWK